MFFHFLFEEFYEFCNTSTPFSIAKCGERKSQILVICKLLGLNTFLITVLYVNLQVSHSTVFSYSQLTILLLTNKNFKFRLDC